MTIPLKWGRPCKRDSVKDLQQSIDAYMDYCYVSEDEIPDVEWLAFFLWTTRKTLYEYEQKKEFSNAIKKVKERIAYSKKQLAMKWKLNPTVFVFDFKNNHNYVDKQEIDQNTNLNVSDVKISIDG